MPFNAILFNHALILFCQKTGRNFVKSTYIIFYFRAMTYTAVNIRNIVACDVEVCGFNT